MLGVGGTCWTWLLSAGRNELLSQDLDVKGRRWTSFLSKDKAMLLAARGHHACGAVPHGGAKANDAEDLLCCSGEGWSGPLWSQGQSLMPDVVLQTSKIFFCGDENNDSLGSSNGTKGLNKVPAVMSTFSSVVGAPQPFTVELFMGSLKSVSCAGVVGDTGDTHCVLESDSWAAQGAHTVFPCRGRRLHDTGGPGDAVPH